MKASTGAFPESMAISALRAFTYCRTDEYEMTAWCSSTRRSKTLCAVCRCFRGASRSASNIASMTAFKGSSLGARREERFLSGGSAAANACRTVLLETLCSRARALIDISRTLASRRILANSSTLNSITAFHCRKNTLMEPTVGWAQLKLRFINRRAVKWAPVKLQTRSQNKLP